MAGKKGGLRKYARTVSSRAGGGPVCQTCASWPQVHETIREYVEGVDAHDPDFRGLPMASSTGESLMTFLAAEFGYDIGETALRRHINRCIRGKTKAGK